jgi:hypothetical protein
VAAVVLDLHRRGGLKGAVPLSEDLDRLDAAIRQLQVKWDTFFSGVEKKPPTEMQAQVEALVRRYANAEIRNSGERFRYHSLTARFSTFNELWQKRLRAREEGKVFGLHGLRAEAVPPPSRAATPPPAAAAAVPRGEFRVGGGESDQTSIRGLYERFVEERQRAGGGAPPPFDSFRQLVAQQTDRIRREKGAAAVDFRLETKDGKVTLKARVVR